MGRLMLVVIVIRLLQPLQRLVEWVIYQLMTYRYVQPKNKKEIKYRCKKIEKLLDKEGKKIDKLGNKIAKSTEKSILTRKFKKPIKFVKKLKKYLKNPPSSTVLGKSSRPKYDKTISALDQNLSKLKQSNKAAKYTALINSTNKNRPEFEGDIPLNKRGIKK